MPPQRTKKAAIASEPTIEAPASGNPGTPERGPQHQQPTITIAQKQALIDNLQLEITERARKLRATYALQTQGLRSRLENRINRIPKSLRSTNITELLEKYAEDLSPQKPRAQPPVLSKPLPDAPGIPASLGSRPNTAASSPPSKGTKRTSTEFLGTSDKENVRADLENPKKRSRVANPPSTTSRAGRVASRRINPSSVLSPKSHNSRTLPQSPLRPPPSSPPKSFLARPISPAKALAPMAPPVAPVVNVIVAREKPKVNGRSASRQAPAKANTGTVRGRRAAAPPSSELKEPRSSNSSHASQSSNGTTIVTTKKGAPAKKGIVVRAVGMATGAGKKTNARKEQEVATVANGRITRALRSRK